MFEELRKKTFKKSLIWSVIVLLAGAALVGWKIYDLFFLTDFSTLKPDEISDQFVKIEMDENWGYFVEEVERNSKTGSERTTAFYCIVRTGDTTDMYATDFRLMGIKVPARYEKKLDEILENFMNDNKSTTLSLRGKIKEMDSVDTRYFREFFLEEDFTSEEIDAATLPLYIDFSYSTLSLNIAFGAGLLLLLYGVVRVVKGAKGGYLKKLRADMAQGGYSEPTVESDYAAAKSYDKKDSIKAGRLMTYYTSGSEIRAIPNNKMIWCYQNTVTHRTNGVKTGTTYNVVFYVDGRKSEITLPVADEATARDLLARISVTFPWVIVGYTDELKKLYKKDRTQFLQLRYNTCEHVAVEPGLENSGTQA